MTVKKELGLPATIPLWPDAGQALGLSKNLTYRAAKAGQIEGIMRFGRVYRVSTAALYRMLQEGQRDHGRK
jgi:hypothetical protein